ncbi:hypothetical protein [Arthrobacter sp.]|uniref:hypothetical protein n=1 Tax=Arthrobacter sp. TaxID=1667 RepID=UPI0039C897EA
MVGGLAVVVEGHPEIFPVNFVIGHRSTSSGFSHATPKRLPWLSQPGYGSGVRPTTCSGVAARISSPSPVCTSPGQALSASSAAETGAW